MLLIRVIFIRKDYSAFSVPFYDMERARSFALWSLKSGIYASVLITKSDESETMLYPSESSEEE